MHVRDNDANKIDEMEKSNGGRMIVIMRRKTFFYILVMVAAANRYSIDGGHTS